MQLRSNGRFAVSGRSTTDTSVLAVSNALNTPPNGSPTNSAPPQRNMSVSPPRIERKAWPTAAVPAAQATEHVAFGPRRE